LKDLQLSQLLDKPKAFFHGPFVQAAYMMYKNPQSADRRRPEPSRIPEGWEVGAFIILVREE
jgi:hypothetical protein